jgi:hypothetical protein
VGSAGEKRGDFANRDKPLPRTRTAAGSHVHIEDDDYNDLN